MREKEQFVKDRHI